MKKIFCFFVVLFLLTGCEDFLDTENLTKKDTSSFPLTPTDVLQSLVGIYATLPFADPLTQQNNLLVSEILSDDRFGGGGDNDRKVQALNLMLKTDDNMFSGFWKIRYQGIFRSNMLLETIDQVVDWNSENQKSQLKGEALFLRAFFYFDLCRVFGTVPLVVTTEAVNNPRATPEELYSLIADDLKNAINTFPSTRFDTSGAPALGHATKWAAEALMARVFLFYTGYYKKESLPVADGGSVTKQDVSNWLEDCITNSGHGMVSDFRNLWPYSNKLTASDYKYAKMNNLSWVEESGKNVETLFAVKFSTVGGPDTYKNCPVCHMSLRSQPDYRKTFPFGQGWGVAPVNPIMWNEWKMKEPDDIRRDGSILNINNPDENIEYTWGQDKQMEEAGFWQKKYTAINHKKEDGGVENFSVPMYGTTPNFQMDNIQDWILIRFADVLLMQAELKQDISYLNQVRHRAGLKSLSAYSLKALQDERRWELAFEGIRFYDLLRWNIAEEALQKQHGASMKNRGVDAVMDMKNIVQRLKDTGGFMQIPQTQIDLSDGVLVQSSGWIGGDLLYTGY